MPVGVFGISDDTTCYLGEKGGAVQAQRSLIIRETRMRVKLMKCKTLVHPGREKRKRKTGRRVAEIRNSELSKMVFCFGEPYRDGKVSPRHAITAGRGDGSTATCPRKHGELSAQAHDKAAIYSDASRNKARGDGPS